MLWHEYWHSQEQHLREQILAAQTGIKELPSTAAPLQKLERSAKHALRRYLRHCVRRATGRILLHHPDGTLLSFSVARKLRRFVLDQCRVRMQIWTSASGNAEYPQRVRTLPEYFANNNHIHVRGLDQARTKHLAPFLALDYAATPGHAAAPGTLWIYPALGTLPAYAQVFCPPPNPRNDGKTCNAFSVYSAVFAERSSFLQPMMEEFRRLVEIEQRRQSLENRLQELHARLQQSSVAQTAWKKIALPDAQKLELMQQADLLLDGKLVCPRAVLLQGPPGTGKTFLATTLAEVLGSRRFFHPTIADLKHPQIGQSAQRVAQLWKQVRASKPAVLFLDECESIFGKRGAAETDAVALELVQTFLSQWNGKEEGVWLIAATNRREMLDDAILSRFGSKMEICLPQEQARVEILEHELAALDVHGELPPDIRARTVGMSGRDLAMLAAQVVAMAYPGAIEARHFYMAIQSMRVAGNTQVDKEATWQTLALDRHTEEKLQTLCALLRNVEAWQLRGVSIPTGILLSGPPGTGKTQIARTLANESGLAFVAASTADLKANFLGQSAHRVKDLFERVRASAPAILFLDEMDVLTRDRDVSGNDALVQEIIGQLLQEIDGIRRSTTHVFLLAATNRVDQIDAAIRSRFQEQIEIPLPNLEARMRLLDIFLRAKPLEVSLAEVSRALAEQSHGMSGRDIQNWIARAEQKAVQRAILQGGPQHFMLRLGDFKDANGQPKPSR
jgi:SpoVK/Ycf46/Vps4 family AAA+-type ATPase